MGIGLTACSMLCKVMGGYIRAVKLKERGSKFKFCIDVTQTMKSSIDFSSNIIKPLYQASQFESKVP